MAVDETMRLSFRGLMWRYSLTLSIFRKCCHRQSLVLHSAVEVLFVRQSFFPLLFYALLLLILRRTLAVCFIWTAGLCHCLCNNAIIMSISSDSRQVIVGQNVHFSITSNKMWFFKAALLKLELIVLLTCNTADQYSIMPTQTNYILYATGTQLHTSTVRVIYTTNQGCSPMQLIIMKSHRWHHACHHPTLWSLKSY